MDSGLVGFFKSVRERQEEEKMIYENCKVSFGKEDFPKRFFFHR